MKILLATGLYPPEVGGPATYTKQLEDELPTHGIEVIVLPFSSVRALPAGVRHIAYFWKCLRIASRVDVVYAQDVVSVGLPASIAARLAHKKFLVRVPGDYAWEQGRQRWGVEDELDPFQTKKYGWRVEVLRAIERRVVRQASSVVVPSEYMVDTLRFGLSS
jgi:glycosyltransferase involved in cell wall biosynthesis